jgi:hypothetical protein
MRSSGLFRCLAVAMFLFAVGCSSNNKGKIEGTKWTSAAATVKGAVVPAGAIGLEFRGDGGLEFKMGPMSFTGTYSLGSGNAVTLKLEKELSGRKIHTETVEINGDNLVMIDSDGTQVKFVRVK